MSRTLVISAFLLFTATAFPSETSSVCDDRNDIADVSPIAKLETKYLPNAVRVHEKVISGGLPEGDSAFAELVALGVKTVISVDGAKPDLTTATKFGIRYVHLPHGYDGIPEQRVTELAKAVRDLPGPIYIHCHHGKHRSPAAATVACVAAGLLSEKVALQVLQVAGTSEHYRGLFESAKSARPIEQVALDQARVEFPAIAKLPAMAEAMVDMERVNDHLKALEAGGWKNIPTKPDLVPAHEALLLREHFTELLRTDEVKRHSKQFQEFMKTSEASAQQFEDALRTWSASKDRTAPSSAAISTAFKRVTDNCKACHEQYRDIPLSEKRK